jgi:hypothetical protein
MSDKILDSELVDKDQDLERIKQLRQEKLSKLENPLLQALAKKESSSGYNTDHIPVNNAMHKGASAGGSFGMMPQSIKDETRLMPDILEQYPELKNSMQDDKLITEAINNNPDMDNEIAKRIWERRANRLGNVPDTLYSWHHGVQGAINQRNKGKDNAQNDYVKAIVSELMKKKGYSPASE